MKKITLNIEEDNFKAFLEFIKTLNYVSIEENISTYEAQEEETSRRIQLVEEGKMKVRNWEEAKKDLF